jgi:hypothetical protein
MLHDFGFPINAEHIKSPIDQSQRQAGAKAAQPDDGELLTFVPACHAQSYLAQAIQDSIILLWFNLYMAGFHSFCRG